MQKETAIGIGCFNFGVKQLPPSDFKGSTYLKELNDCLKKIPNLNNLKIDADDDFKNTSIKIEDPIPDFDESGYCFPHAFHLEIQFDLYIPFRIQAEISETDQKYLQTYSESFKVTICHTYHFPVTIIEVLNPIKETDPSSSVRIVREFLKKQIGDDELYIKFECLGPSPFHIDCFIKPQEPAKDDEDWLFNPVEKKQKGYDKIILNYNSSEIKNANEALEYLKEFMFDEFGFCYKYISIRNAKMHQWSEIESHLDELLEIRKKHGIKGLWSKLTRRTLLIENVFTSLTEFEANDIFMSSLQQNEYNEIYYVKEQTFFQNFIDKELNEKTNYPVRQMSDLVTFFESRRVKSVELIIVIIAALIGGAIGSILTLSFQ